jgi:hypothetical protein
VRKGLLASKKLILENLHAPTSLSGIPGGRLQEHKCGFICARGFKSGDPAIDSARKYSCTNTQQNRRSCRPSSGEETILSRGNRRTTSVVGVPFFTCCCSGKAPCLGKRQENSYALCREIVLWSGKNIGRITWSRLYSQVCCKLFFQKSVIISVDVVSSDILSRNGKNATMQDQSQGRTRRVFRLVRTLQRVKDCCIMRCKRLVAWMLER